MNAAEVVGRYLNELCWAMGGHFAEQQAVRDEFRAHIAEAMREHELAGVSHEAALAKTLRNLGDPTDLGRRLRSSRGTPSLRRPLMQPEGAIVLGPRRTRAMPSLPVVLALVGAAVASVAVMLAYAWP